MIISKGQNFSFLEKTRDFFYSPCFLALQLLISGVFFISDEIAVAVALISLISLVFLLSEDLLPILSLVFLAAMCFSKLYLFDPKDALQYWPCVAMLVVCMILHYVLYPKKLKAGKLLIPNCCVAIALLLGGFAYLTFREYFAFNVLFFSVGLSLGMIVTYILFYTHICPPSHIKIKDAFAKQMILVCCMGILMMASVILPIMGNDDFYYHVQWKNSLSSFLLLAMPFCFYYALRAKHGIPYFILGLFTYATMFTSLSRGGMIFGTLSVVACIIACIFLAKTRGKKLAFYAITSLGLCAFICLIYPSEGFQSVLEAFSVSDEEVRIKLYRMAMTNFFNYPLFGVGIGFVGSGVGYDPQGGMMFWYHSTFFQIIASMGMAGVFAYSVQYIARAKVLFGKKSLFNLYMILSFIGFELYQLVDVGEFSTIPWMLLLVLFFVVCEHSNNDNTAQEYPREWLSKDVMQQWRIENYK